MLTRSQAIKIVKRKPKQRHLPRETPLPSSSNGGRSRLPVANNIGSTENKIRKEIAIMKKCSHHHVVELLEVIDDPMDKKIYMGQSPPPPRASAPSMTSSPRVQSSSTWKAARSSGAKATVTIPSSPSIRPDASSETSCSASSIVRPFAPTHCALTHRRSSLRLHPRAVHFQGVIHRDIKPSNLLWNKDRSIVKISDFGVSHFSYAQRLAEAGNAEAGMDQPLEDVLMDESDLSKTAGSPAFFAPELCYQGEDAGTPAARLQPRYTVTKAIDIWALGITLFCLLFGRPPLDADTEYQLYQMIPREPLKVPERMGVDCIPTGGIDNTLPHDSLGWMAVDMLKKLLEKDPTQRITIGAIKASLPVPPPVSLCLRPVGADVPRRAVHPRPTHPSFMAPGKS